MKAPMNPTIPKVKSGVISLLIAYHWNGSIAGHGYMLHWDDVLEHPILSDSDGIALPEAWYMLKITNYKLVLISELIH